MSQQQDIAAAETGGTAPSDSEDEWQPVLQIVHVTDLHVKDVSANPHTTLQGGKLRTFGRTLLEYAERKGLKKWDEGTQGHYPLAPESFRRFLRDFRRGAPRWAGVPFWLVDTGDRTAFGDAASLDAGQRHLSKWQQELGDCPTRTLYGNHDAWPGTFPLFVGAEAHGVQKGLVQSRPGWSPQEWLDAPLAIELPGSTGRIELFAFDSVCWSSVRNARAVGTLEQAALDQLVERLRITSSEPSLRILAMHHPVAFPWLESETSFAGAAVMKLLEEDRCAKQLRNDAGDPPKVGPLVHLMLSGHTHLAHPGHGSLTGDVVNVRQGLLAASQLQLVGGALMLNKSFTELTAAADGGNHVAAHVIDRKAELFAPATVSPHHCQAQILRFLACASHPGSLQLVRIPVFSKDGTLYEAGDADGTMLHFQTA